MIIKEVFIAKFDTRILGLSDLEDYYKIYVDIANNTEDIQKYSKKWNFAIQIDLGGEGDHWVSMKNGEMNVDSGITESSNSTIKLSKDQLLAMYCWTSDYTIGQFGNNIEVQGNLTDFDNFIWLDFLIRGEMLSKINKIKTKQTVKDKYILPYNDFLLMQKRLREKVDQFNEFRNAPYSSDDPEVIDSIGLRIEQRAAEFPDRNMLFFEDEKYTNKEFNEWVNRYANFFLNEVGLKKGDEVVVFLENRSEIFFVIIAMAKIGAISSLINTRQRDKPLIHSITHAHGKSFIIGEELIETFLEIQDRLNLTEDQNSNLYFLEDKGEKSVPPGFKALKSLIRNSIVSNPLTTGEIMQKEPYSYIFTSGTTGLPKAAVITNQHTIGASFYWGKIVMDMNPDDVTYITTPIFHSNAINIGFASVLGGGGAMAIRRKYSASNFLKDARRYGCTTFNYVGEICRYLYNQPPKDDDRDHPIIKCAGNGIKPEFWMDFKNRFGIERIHEQYGATERFIPNFANTLNLDKTVGICLSAYTIVKYDVANDEPMRDNNNHMIMVEPGEIGLLLGQVNTDLFYMYKDEKATEKKVFRNVYVDGDMWVNTGDLLRDIGFRHAMFADRLGDTYRWKGENVSSEEMEILINSYEQVEYCSAYGVLIPGTEGRAGMISFIKKGDEDFDFKKFFEFVDEKIPTYAVPIFLRIKTKFETTATDKVQKVKLKQEGYENDQIDDPIYVLLPKTSKYVPITDEIYKKIKAGEFRF